MLVSETNNRFAIVQREAYEKIMEAGKPELLGTFCALLMHTFGSGECNPSLDTLVTASKQSERTVIRHAQALESLGLITIVANIRADGGYSSNTYQINSWKLFGTLGVICPSSTNDRTPSSTNDRSNIKGLKNTISKNISRSARTSVTYGERQDALIERIRAEYPKRLGGSGWNPATAVKIKAIPEKDWDTVIRGVIGYRCEMGKAENVGTEYVKQISTFFNQVCWREFSTPEFYNPKVPEPVEGVDYRIIEKGIGRYFWDLNEDKAFDLKAWQNAWRVANGVEPKL